VTEIQKVPGRGHALTIDRGWREVAEIALGFVRRFVPAGEKVADVWIRWDDCLTYRGVTKSPSSGRPAFSQSSKPPE
jgi:hypothetical protein